MRIKAALTPYQRSLFLQQIEATVEGYTLTTTQRTTDPEVSAHTKQICSTAPKGTSQKVGWKGKNQGSFIYESSAIWVLAQDASN